ncbi:prepilin-type N-terminal cleavage/methylation domain-containing protein [Pseudomonas sp. ABC1]|uniref:PulJ/GspJ family protein n=1 Tax=Pseudomonas sp. ABC1 TaxID=2748080 RepID=UPI0015C32D12|nr:prepilin-type N-terminal cleavage/methylation domain-containing protein [Pseudomonas sp. ABC1]QLF92447.1 prepilin-type N-terminal cleavage/methylation domain-containing protein [Pseudomonas sp. ABC1]
MLIFRKPTRQQGFTLIEMIMVIVLASIVVVLVSTAMNRPLKAFTDQRLRASLTDQAAIVLDRMARDIRLAVPNSVRVAGAGGTTLDLMLIEVAGRYRANTIVSNGERFDPPRCPAGACTIPILGPFQVPSVSTTGYWLIIYNTRPENIWGNSLVKAAFAWNSVTSELSKGVGTPEVLFPNASPQHRLYMAKDTVRYQCAGSRLSRHEAPDVTFTKGTPTILANSVGTCRFHYDAGTLERNGLVTIELKLQQDGESVTLYRQVQVNNAP